MKNSLYTYLFLINVGISVSVLHRVPYSPASPHLYLYCESIAVGCCLGVSPIKQGVYRGVSYQCQCGGWSEARQL